MSRANSTTELKLHPHPCQNRHDAYPFAHQCLNGERFLHGPYKGGVLLLTDGVDDVCDVGGQFYVEGVFEIASVAFVGFNKDATATSKPCVYVRAANSDRALSHSDCLQTSDGVVVVGPLPGPQRDWAMAGASCMAVSRS